MSAVRPPPTPVASLEGEVTRSVASSSMEAPVEMAHGTEELSDNDGCAETEDDDACVVFCKKMFRKVPEPLLPTPAPPSPVFKQARKPRSRGARRALAPTRTSLRQAARASSTPVAQRAQLRLMRELDFVNGKPSALDTAVTECIDSFGRDFSEEAIKALRTAARLDDIELCRALDAIAVGSETDMLEVS